MQLNRAVSLWENHIVIQRLMAFSVAAMAGTASDSPHHMDRFPLSMERANHIPIWSTPSGSNRPRLLPWRRCFSQKEHAQRNLIGCSSMSQAIPRFPEQFTTGVLANKDRAAVKKRFSSDCASVVALYCFAASSGYPDREYPDRRVELHRSSVRVRSGPLVLLVYAVTFSFNLILRFRHSSGEHDADADSG